MLHKNEVILSNHVAKKGTLVRRFHLKCLLLSQCLSPPSIQVELFRNKKGGTFIQCPLALHGTKTYI